MMQKFARILSVSTIAAGVLLTSGAPVAVAQPTFVSPNDPCYMATVSRTATAYTAVAKGGCATTHVRAYVNCQLSGTAHFVGNWVQGGGKSTAIHTCTATDWGYDRQNLSGGTIYSYSLKGV
jgi:hypothetical protein